MVTYTCMTQPTKKILLVSVSTGSGHVRAAQALERMAKAKFPGMDVTHIDMMDYVSLPLKKTILDSYNLLATQLPGVWGFFYKKTNKLKISQYVQKLAGLLNTINTGPFYRYIKKTQPDIILCTHFLPIHALSTVPHLNNKKTGKVSILLTDYDNHSFQTLPIIDHYFVSCEKIKWRMIYMGIPEENITVSGIPVDPVFYENKPLDSLNKEYQISKTQKNILVLAGGQGMVDTGKIISTLFRSKQNLHIFTVAGTNDKLKRELEKLSPPENMRLDVIGWTDKMDEYMRIADIIITKPGGLTTTECIVLKKPIIAISPIPGQEEYNAEYILENNFGAVARAPEDLLYYIEKNTPVFSNLKNEQNNKKPSAEIILEELQKDL